MAIPEFQHTGSLNRRDRSLDSKLVCLQAERQNCFKDAVVTHDQSCWTYGGAYAY